MLKRLLIICFGLGCFTTFIAFQQTQQHKIRFENVVLKIHQIPAKEEKVISSEHKIRSARGSHIDLQSSSHQSVVDQYYERLFNTEPFISGINVSDQARRPRRDKLLLPLLYYNMGPNNLFRIFKEVVPVAYFMERTLVVPPFHHHPRMKRQQEEEKRKKQRDVINVDIFDQTYKSVIETNAERSIDVRILQKLIPAVPIKRFYAECDHHIHTLVTCGIVSGKREDGLNHFKAFTNITIGRKFLVNNLHDVVDGRKLKVNLLSAIHKTEDERCVALAIGSKCLGRRKEWFNHWRPFSAFIRRPPEINILANEFVSSVFRKQPFLALHWRYENEDWQDMCKSSRPDAVRKINEPMCQMALQLSTNRSMMNTVARRLRSYAELKGFKYIYLSTPPQMLQTIKRLKEQVAGLYFVADVNEFAQTKSLMTDIFENNYSTSFLEQEICYRADLFLGSPLSSWTQTVLLDRSAIGKNKHGNVLEVLFEDATNLPKLTWYFPEGN